MENIIQLCGKVIFAILTAILYVYIVSKILPHFTLRLKCDENKLIARGVRRVQFSDGRGIIYEPEPRIRKYIKYYAVLAQNNKKYIQCDIHEKISSLRYDVASFDLSGKLLDIVSINERITSQGKTSLTVLPTQTAYAYVIPRRIDAMLIKNERIFFYPLRGVITFSAITVCLTMLTSYCIHDAIAEIFLNVFSIYDPTNSVMLLSISFICGILMSAFAFLTQYLHSHRVINR